MFLNDFNKWVTSGVYASDVKSEMMTCSTSHLTQFSLGILNYYPAGTGSKSSLEYSVPSVSLATKT